LLFLFICSALHADIEFFKEYLRFELQDGCFIVAGNYYFRNTSNRDIQATLFYPIPRDSMLGSYDSVEVKDSSQAPDSLVTAIREKGFFFNVEIGANSTAKYTISYRQKLLGNRAKYIFTTTKSWGKPLEKADFLLTFPKTLKIDFLSILPDSLREYEDTYTLFWTRENFMPQEDFVVHYHEESVNDISSPETFIEKRHEFMYLRITPLIIPGIAAGYTRRINVSEIRVIDVTIAVNYHDLDVYFPEVYKSYGLSLITEHFSNPKATGLFSRLNLGAEYLKIHNTDCNQEEIREWYPNTTIGGGVSMPFNKVSYIRLSLEIGFTMLYARINCEFFF